jgi:hypothetical protein
MASLAAAAVGWGGGRQQQHTMQCQPACCECVCIPPTLQAAPPAGLTAPAPGCALSLSFSIHWGVNAEGSSEEVCRNMISAGVCWWMLSCRYLEAYSSGQGGSAAPCVVARVANEWGQRRTAAWFVSTRASLRRQLLLLLVLLRWSLRHCWWEAAADPTAPNAVWTKLLVTQVLDGYRGWDAPWSTSLLTPSLHSWLAGVAWGACTYLLLSPSVAACMNCTRRNMYATWWWRQGRLCMQPCTCTHAPHCWGRLELRGRRAACWNTNGAEIVGM